LNRFGLFHFGSRCSSWLDEFYHHFGMSLQTLKFALFDFEMADENDGGGHFHSPFMPYGGSA